jgi:hypothetical protein
MVCASGSAQLGVPEQVCNLQEVRSVTREFTWPDVPSALHEARPWGTVGIEPTVSEMLADPLVQALMRRDGVSRTALESLIADAQRRLRLPPRRSPRH